MNAAAHLCMLKRLFTPTKKTKLNYYVFLVIMIPKLQLLFVLEESCSDVIGGHCIFVLY